jgi:hypothetical protein
MAQGGIATMGTTLTIGGQGIYGIQDISGPALSTDTDEVTNHDSPNFTEEFLATIKRTGEISFPLVVDTEDVGFADLFDAWDARSKDAYVLTYPDGTTISFDAYVTGFGLSAPYAGHLSADVTLRPAAAPTIAWAGS